MTTLLWIVQSTPVIFFAIIFNDDLNIISHDTDRVWCTHLVLTEGDIYQHLRIVYVFPSQTAISLDVTYDNVTALDLAGGNFQTTLFTDGRVHSLQVKVPMHLPKIPMKL